ncbi:hypothetical protein [Couchioplanes azureus]|uniref:hypothetical protein n=1 Tax=Couchioplanes caeruleus TaxID=56438 RepID=UPI00167068F7|nr:hypothetical protein [Couchioplanes caeruleus]GGQ67287.1 hypothetical protein GCM10010166_41460 [Couchioplanes caeruleus subsp. azureus]
MPPRRHGRRRSRLVSADARAVLAPATAAKLTKTRVAAALRRGGRERGVDNLRPVRAAFPELA